MTFKKLFLTVLVSVLTTIGGFAQSPGEEPGEKIITFRFVPGNDMFYIPWSGNGSELERLYMLIDEYRTEIISGNMPVYVDGYCSSLSTRKENLNTAFVRANRVKSELIVHKGLLEKHFITKNYAERYQGQKDIVVVTLRIPAKPEEPKLELRAESEPQPTPQPEPIPDPRPGPLIVPEPVAGQDYFAPFSIRTNLLYDAFLAPTLGVEWRINPSVGIKLDGSFAHWGNEHGKVQKMWLVSPEIRWYMGGPKRFYLGASANIGEFNLYKYVIGNILSGDTGHQGNMYGGGLTVGYQLPLCESFAIDFNLGLGYTRYKYDTFYLSNEVRVYKERDLSKNFWGPTQAGISLVWKLNRKPLPASPRGR